MNEPKLTFLDFSNNQSKSVPDNKIKLIIDGKAVNRIVLNGTITENIKNGFVHLRVGFAEYSNDCYFIFCKKQSPDSLILKPGSRLTSINSKYLVDELINKLNLSSRSQVLNLSDSVSNSPEYVTYRVSKE